MEVDHIRLNEIIDETSPSIVITNKDLGETSGGIHHLRVTLMAEALMGQVEGGEELHWISRASMTRSCVPNVETLCIPSLALDRLIREVDPNYILSL